ncbi:hypothetical protein GCM10017044_13110 [Kordiimonas sediminis]|uniref:DUF2189 domain-containing protein n=1 Tax=Kordiimonas sediminis TaxID=1735581 RepID=A0A919AQF8_9PROT|nr:DUF2189 domain-containing protein [Kordiimonas sediminis]GHF19726.1 hypothetical protein GCM10017044_13110 [Kordiimonas sediminis]
MATTTPKKAEPTKKAQKQAGSLPESILDLKLNSISAEDPWRWLAKGWTDIWKHPAHSLGYGAIFSGLAVLIFFGLMQLEMTGMIVVLASGFMLLGPLFAVGLYELSRRVERGEKVTTRSMMFVRTHSPLQLAYMGVVFMIFYIAWARIASLLYAIFFGMEAFPPLEEFLPNLLFSAQGAWMLAIGTLIGGAIALVVFAVSVIGIPLLYHRNTDFVSACLLSLRAFVDNLYPMLIWAWLIVLFSAFGLMTLFAGMVIIFPLVGHASWHAYRAIVPQPEPLPLETDTK